MHLAKLAHKTKNLNSVFNAISGRSKKIGDNLVANSSVNVIFFTGLATNGNQLAKKLLKINWILELGGKNPGIVLNNAALKDTANKIIKVFLVTQVNAVQLLKE